VPQQRVSLPACVFASLFAILAKGRWPSSKSNNPESKTETSAGWASLFLREMAASVSRSCEVGNIESISLLPWYATGHGRESKEAWGHLAIVLLAMALLAYPLSTGPAFAMIGASGCNRTLIRVFQWVYDPLRPFEPALDPWVNLWDFYGIRRGGGC
jgi:hypothetical protein